jgi:hypothetical protein
LLLLFAAAAAAEGRGKNACLVEIRLHWVEYQEKWMMT